VGVWTTPDPIGILGGLNVYSYVENNPVNLIDSLGLFWGNDDNDSPSAGELGIGNPGSYGAENTKDSMRDAFGVGEDNPYDNIDELTSGENLAITLISSAVGIVSGLLGGGPLGGALAASVTAGALTKALGGDWSEAGVNAAFGFGGAYGGGMLGNLGRSANAVRPGQGSALGYLSGEALDAILYKSSQELSSDSSDTDCQEE